MTGAIIRKERVGAKVRERLLINIAKGMTEQEQTGSIEAKRLEKRGANLEDLSTFTKNPGLK